MRLLTFPGLTSSDARECIASGCTNVAARNGEALFCETCSREIASVTRARRVVRQNERAVSARLARRRRLRVVEVALVVLAYSAFGLLAWWLA